MSVPSVRRLMSARSLVALATLGIALATNPGIAQAADEVPLVFYLGEPSDRAAEVARAAAARALGTADPSTLRVEPLLHAGFREARIWPTGGTVRLCPPDVAETSLGDRIEKAAGRLDELDFAGAETELAVLDGQLACLGPPLDSHLLARAALLLGYARFQREDRRGAGTAFAMSAVFDPEVAWDEVYSPDAQQVFNSAVLESLRTPAAHLALGPEEAAELQLRLDGSGFPLDRSLRPGWHQVTVPTLTGQPLQLAVRVPPGSTIEMSPVTDLMDSYVAGCPGLGSVGDALQAAVTAATRREAYVVAVETGRVRRYSAFTQLLEPLGDDDCAAGLTAPLARRPVAGPVMVLAGAAVGAVGLTISLTQRSRALGIHELVTADPTLHDEMVGDYEAAGRAMTAGFVIAGVGGVALGIGIPVWIREGRLRGSVRLHWDGELRGGPAAAIRWEGTW